MRRTRLAERLVLVLVGVLVAWNAWTLRGIQSDLDDQGGRIEALEVRLDVLAEAERIQRTLPLPGELFQPSASAQAAAAARGGRAGGSTAGGQPPLRGPATSPEAARAGRSFASQEVPDVPGAMVLSKLYNAADELAVAENWDAETYDQVALVFEDTNTDMTDLFYALKDGRVNMSEARRAALGIRDKAQENLLDVIGPDGLERLKGEIREEIEPLRPRR